MKYRVKQLFYLRAMCLLVIVLTWGQVSAFPPKREYYELKVYHFKDQAQEARLDSFFQSAYLPALHRRGIKTVGVFKAINNDTASDKRIFVLIPYKSLEHFKTISDQLLKDKDLETTGGDYYNTAYNNPTFSRIESILSYAFPEHPTLGLPVLRSPKSERVYELRSYESATEKLHQSKVKMFNEGGEVRIFNNLGFNAVFYSAAISGSRMPNLFYMTTFENRQARDEHWKAFSADADWKAISAMPEYKNNVSRNETIFLRPAEYSDF